MIRDAVISGILKRNPDLSDWAFWEELGIFNPVSLAQYQHYVPITWRHGMMHDFRDLRFFQADGTRLDYWNQSKTDGTSAGFQVKVERPSQSRIYVFYGNPVAASKSSSALVFPLFVDEFLGTSLDGAKWTSSGTVAVDGTLKLGSTVNTDTGYVTSVSSFPVNTTLEMRAKIDTAASGTYQIGYYDTQYVLILGSGSTLTPYNNDGGSANGSNMGNLDAYHTWVIKRNSTTSTIFSVDGGGAQTLSTHVPTGSLKMRHYGGGQVNKLTTFDYMHIRQYVETEPTVQVLSYGNRNPEYR